MNQWRVNLKPIAACARAFSRALQKLWFLIALLDPLRFALTGLCCLNDLELFQPITSTVIPKPIADSLCMVISCHVLSQSQVWHCTCLISLYSGKWLLSTYCLIRISASFMIGYIVDQLQVKENKPWHTSISFPVPYARYKNWLWVLVGWMEPSSASFMKVIVLLWISQHQSKAAS